MCGGRYLLSLKNINTSEKIIRIKFLVQEGFNIEGLRRESTNLVNDFEELMRRHSLPLALDAGSKEVSDHIAGYIAFKLQKFYVCQECDLVSHDVSASGHSTYVTELSRGGLTFPSAHFSEFVAQSLPS